MKSIYVSAYFKINPIIIAGIFLPVSHSQRMVPLLYGITLPLNILISSTTLSYKENGFSSFFVSIPSYSLNVVLFRFYHGSVLKRFKSISVI